MGLFAIQSLAVPLIWSDYFTVSPPQYDLISTATLLDRIVSLGANDVRLLGSYGTLKDPAGNVYSTDTPQSIASLKTFTDAAHAKGLTITWNPMTHFKDVVAGDNTQDSHMHPSDPALWFANFRVVVLEQANIAQTIGAERFMLLTDVEQFAFLRNPDLADKMVALIQDVRKVYSGQITGMFWTPDGNLNGMPVDILKALDLIGLGVFPKLTEKLEPTLAELQAAWHGDVSGNDILANLAKLAATTGKSIWFGDVAQSSYDGWLRDNPQKFDPGAQFKVDNSEQVLGYQAMFSEIMKSGYPWFQGVSIQNISRVDDAYGQHPPYLDSPVGENFWGKPGAEVIKDYFLGRISAPASELRGTNYGEALQGGFGPNTIYAGPADQAVRGGPVGDTIYASAPTTATVHELRLTVGGQRVGGQLPTFKLLVNGRVLPDEYAVTAPVGTPPTTLSIPILLTEKITSLQIVTNNWTATLGDPSSNRYMRIQEVTLDGVSLKAANPIYHPVAQAAEAFTGDTNRGGYISYDTAALNTTANYKVAFSANLTIDGDAGRDTVVYAGVAADYSVTRAGSTWVVQKLGVATGQGRDVLTNVEVLKFADKSVAIGTALPATVETAFANILRTASASAAGLSVGGRIDENIASGQATSAQAIAEIVKAATATTSVATLSYQFFTGKIPTQVGIDFLISPTGPNTTNLNSAYYAQFDTINRYINFAVNLGKNGEGKESFLTNYGALSLFEATKKAYGVIFGATPTDAKVHALIDTRVDYLAYYGGDGANGIGTKAAMVGFLLAAAATEHVGMYAKANDAFLGDLADGATFAVDLVGVYGKPDYVFQPG